MLVGSSLFPIVMSVSASAYPWFLSMVMVGVVSSFSSWFMVNGSRTNVPVPMLMVYLSVGCFSTCFAVNRGMSQYSPVAMVLYRLSQIFIVGLSSVVGIMSHSWMLGAVGM